MTFENDIVEKKAENPEKYEELKKKDRESKKAEYHREKVDNSRLGCYRRKMTRERKAREAYQCRHKGNADTRVMHKDKISKYWW